MRKDGMTGVSESWSDGLTNGSLVLATFQYSSYPTFQYSWGDIYEILSMSHQLKRLNLLCLIVMTRRAFVWGGRHSAQPRAHRRRRGQCRFIADVGRLTTAATSRARVPAELIYIRGGPQTMSALVSGEVPFAQIYGGALVAAGLTGADVRDRRGIDQLNPFFDRHDQRNR